MTKKLKSYKTDRPCVPCGHEAENENCLHHVKSRGAGGTDDPYNLIPVCRSCHNLFHDNGAVFMADRFLSVKDWLHENNWYLNNELDKWKHAK